jgi:hypothetical protein
MQYIGILKAAEAGMLLFTTKTMLFIIDNSNNFKTGSDIHRLNTRSKNHLFIPVTNLTVFKKELHILVLKYLTVCPTAL